MQENERLNYLDSIRGIAALAVMLHHLWFFNHGLEGPYKALPSFLIPLSDAFYYILGLFFTVGRAAVMVFFVLSGFVLAYSLLKQPVAYGQFAIRRVFRIYPAFLAAVLISYALYSLTGIRNPYVSGLLKEMVEVHPSLKMLLEHLLLFGTKGSTVLDDVIWSLVHEMRISLIFPFILLCIIRYKWHTVAACWLISIACTFTIFFTTGLPEQEGVVESSILRSFLNTGYFVIFFAGGTYLAVEREKVATKIASLPKWQHITLFAFSMFCLLKTNPYASPFTPSFFDYMRGIGALGLIALALGSNRFATALNHKILTWLGRISYSLYLVHVPIIYVVSQEIGTAWPMLATSVFIIAVSLIMAELMARFIEFPSIRLGKRLCAKIAVRTTADYAR